jgi:hypothetical protein
MVKLIIFLVAILWALHSIELQHLRASDSIVRLGRSRKFVETNKYLRWKKRGILCRFYFHHIFEGSDIKKKQRKKLEDVV